MNRKGSISQTQLTALVWAGLLAPAAELFPQITLPVAGRAAWLSPLCAVPLVLLFCALLSRIPQEKGLAKGIRETLGPWIGTTVLIFFLLWGELLLSLRLRLCAQRLVAAGDRDGSLSFFLLGTAVVAMWIGTGKPASFARAGQLFLTILLVTAGAILLLSIPQVRPERVLPLVSEDIRPVAISTLPAAGALGWGIFAAFLTEGVRRPEGRWWSRFWGAGGCLLLCAEQWILLGVFGSGLAGRLDSPFFSLAKNVGIEGAFQRVESIVGALWTLSDLVMAGILLFALRYAVQALNPKADVARIAIAASVLAAAGAFFLFPGETAGYWNRDLVPWGNLILGFGAPVLCIVGKHVRRR